MVAILGVIKPCTCSYTRTLRFLIPRSCAYLYFVNLASEPPQNTKYYSNLYFCLLKTETPPPHKMNFLGLRLCANFTESLRTVHNLVFCPSFCYLPFTIRKVCCC